MSKKYINIIQIPLQRGSMSKKPEVKKESENREDDIGIDFSNVTSFFKNFNLPKMKNWTVLILVLIPIFFAIFFRAYPISLPVTDEWAENSVRNAVTSQVSSQIDEQYPHLPAASRQAIINEQVAVFMKENKAQVSDQISALSNQFKSRLKDEDGQTYLLAIDPYFYYRYSRNILENGQIGDQVIDGQQWDDHMEAPLGRPIKNELHYHVLVAVNGFMSIFSNQSLLANSFIVPIILSALAVIPAFFIARKRAGNLGGFIAGMIVAVQAAFLGRTAGGFSDTDAYNVLFPLFIAWLFMEAFETTNFKKKIVLLLTTGLVVGVYSFAWIGWWYIFDFLVGVTISYLIYSVVKRYLLTKSLSKMWNKEIGSNFLFLIMFVGFAAVFVILISNFVTLSQAATGPFAFTVIKQAALPTLWPNVYTTVAELNPASLNAIISQIGGTFLFFLASLGVLLTLVGKYTFSKKDYIFLGVGAVFYFVLVSNIGTIQPLTFSILFLLPVLVGVFSLLWDKRNINLKYALLMVAWFIGTIYASTKGARFILLIVPVFAVGIGIFSGMFHRILTNLASKSLNLKKSFASVILIIIVLLLLINPIRAAHQTARNEIPSMNDAWWNSLKNIDAKAEPNAIITSWWDFGHWFKAIADRPVTFDGASQNSPRAHWVGHALMTSDEETSIDILRMLDCGGNSAFEEIDKLTGDTEHSYFMLREIISMDKSEAEKYLFEKEYSQKDIENILSRTHCDPPEAYFITSGDMIGKAGVWGHFGSWNFTRAWMANNVKNKPLSTAVDMMIDRYGISDDEANNIYFQLQSLNTDQAINAWISPWPNYAGKGSGCKEQYFNDTNEDGIICNFNMGIGNQNNQQFVMQNVVIFPKSMNDSYGIFAAIDSRTGTQVGTSTITFRKVSYASNRSKVVEHEFDNPGLAFELFVSQQSDGSYGAVMADPLLAQSTFTKLFYLDGAHTTHFEKFSDQTTVFGSRIIVWKVNWDGV